MQAMEARTLALSVGIVSRKKLVGMFHKYGEKEVEAVMATAPSVPKTDPAAEEKAHEKAVLGALKKAPPAPKGIPQQPGIGAQKPFQGKSSIKQQARFSRQNLRELFQRDKPQKKTSSQMTKNLTKILPAVKRFIQRTNKEQRNRRTAAA